MKELSNRTATFTDSVIRRMTRISNKYGAVNLSQGFPDFDPPAQLLDSLSTIATDPKPLYHQYSITWGSQAMREALAAKQEHFMGMSVNPNENIVVTCGSTEAMMAAMRATPMTSPFLAVPAAQSANVAGAIWISPLARAMRFVCALAPTSTICASPLASKCVNSPIALKPSNKLQTIPSVTSGHNSEVVSGE